MNRSHRAGAMALLCAFILPPLLTPASATFTKMRNLTSNYADGNYPVGVMVNNGGSFFGCTQTGGAGYGTFFKSSTAGTVTTLASFTGGAAGPYYPNSGPVLHGSNTYFGTSIYGGASAVGTIYK